MKYKKCSAKPYISGRFDLFNEHDVFEKDTKYFDTRRQKVLNKHARHNLCFKDEDQESDYDNKKGTVVSLIEYL